MLESTTGRWVAYLRLEDQPGLSPITTVGRYDTVEEAQVATDEVWAATKPRRSADMRGARVAERRIEDGHRAGVSPMPGWPLGSCHPCDTSLATPSRQTTSH